MKNKLIFVFIALCFVGQTFGQKTASVRDFLKYPNADYFYDAELPKFVGTWVWQSGSDRFEIEIIKGIMNFGEISMESALGGVKYIKNGAIINDQMQTSYSTYASSIYGNVMQENILTMIISDRTHKTHYKGSITLDPKDPRKAVIEFSKYTIEWAPKSSNIIYYPSGITLIKK